MGPGCQVETPYKGLYLITELDEQYCQGQPVDGRPIGFVHVSRLKPLAKQEAFLYLHQRMMTLNTGKVAQPILVLPVAELSFSQLNTIPEIVSDFQGWPCSLPHRAVK